MKCTIYDAQETKMLGGEGLPYSAANLEEDFQNKNGGFIVTWEGTDFKKHFIWRQTVKVADKLKFFGAPLSMTRSFDSIFCNVNDESTPYHRFYCSYKEFEGDCESCTALANSYFARYVAMLKERAKTNAAKPMSFNKDYLRSPSVVKFMYNVDETFYEHMEAMFTSFRKNSVPIVNLPQMEEFIDEAPVVFGDLWKLLCDLRGVKENQKAEVQRNIGIGRKWDVFFQIMSMARISNRQKLQWWAMALNVTNFSRGINQIAERAISFFGHSVSNPTHRRLFAKLTGNNPKDRAKGSD